MELSVAKGKQLRAGIARYQTGDRIIVHLDYTKTRSKFFKRRRTFDSIGTFIRYVHGNVEVQLDIPIDGKQIVLEPIYCTKLLNPNKNINRLFSSN